MSFWGQDTFNILKHHCVSCLEEYLEVGIKQSSSASLYIWLCLIFALKKVWSACIEMALSSGGTFSGYWGGLKRFVCINKLKYVITHGHLSYIS